MTGTSAYTGAGREVGAAVGTRVGAGVGTAVGAAVGTAVGTAVGAGLYSTVGADVGIEEIAFGIATTATAGSWTTAAGAGCDGMGVGLADATGVATGLPVTRMPVTTTDTTIRATAPAATSTIVWVDVRFSPRDAGPRLAPGIRCARSPSSWALWRAAFLSASLIMLISGCSACEGFHLADRAARVPEVHLVGLPDIRRKHGLV